MKQLSLSVLLALALMSLVLTPPPSAQAQPPAPPRLTPLGDGVRVEWMGAPDSLRASTAPLVTIGGVQLPAQLVALQIASDAPVAPQLERLTSEPWRGVVPAAEQIIPQLAGGAARPGLAAPANLSLPDSPVVLLREARLRGTRIAVLALSPVFAAPGGPRAVTGLSFDVPGAAPLPDDPSAALDAAGPFLAAAPASNPAAGNGWKVSVAQAGMQRLPAVALAAAGVPLANPALLQLHYNGAEVALEQRGAGASLELRFYAPAPGDRWNSADSYWLTLGAEPGLRMLPPRAVTPGAAPLSGFAFERGVWSDNRLYDSLLAGPDADHWFAADMRIAPAPPGQPPVPPVVTTVLITPTLPLVASTTILTVTGSSYLDAAHTLQVFMGGAGSAATWSGTGDWAHVLMFPKPAGRIQLKLPPTAAPDGYEIDQVAWQAPVSLDARGRGAAFVGRAGSWRYQIANAPAGGVLYDVSDPLAPRALAGLHAVSPSASQFQDGPAARQYLLAGQGTLFAPAIARSQPYDFGTPARVLYIAPAALRDGLAPLVARRRAQGYSVRVIDVQAIYERWSYGQVSPAAIRDFLRYTAAAWATPPIGVTLVGDGTVDPHNYTGRNNTNYIPPFLADVDPWIGETACEQCFARLNGAGPLGDELPDVALGRLPVRSPGELAALARKIVAYETSPLDLLWRSRNVYIADNYRDGQNATDPAGDFAAFADASAAQQPAGIQIGRLYYDPLPAPGQPWRERDAVRAYQRTKQLIGAGAGLVNYVGHGSQYQWAVTDYGKQPPYLLGQYDPDELGNGPRQPIVLEMTCLTGAFQTPSYGGTIDERLLLNPDGGAIAVWAPTGQGVAHGHEALQRGFYQKLWSAPPLSARLGQLTVAGYTELFTNGLCCHDTIATYALLGDAMQVARVLPARQLYLPVAGDSGE